MDIAAHALWSGAIYHKKRVWWAIFFGVAPDLFSFGVLTIARMFQQGVSSLFLAGEVERTQYLLQVPDYVYSLYNVTHSLTVWAVLCIIGWLYFKRIPWEFTAWGLHILIDIPTHASTFFPTPFLWPLPQPFFVNSISWGTPWFMILNYAAITFVYLVLFRKKIFRA